MFRAFVGMPPRPGCRSGGSGLAFNGRMASGSQADNRLNTASKVLCRWQFRPSRRYLSPWIGAQTVRRRASCASPPRRRTAACLRLTWCGDATRRRGTRRRGCCPHHCRNGRFAALPVRLFNPHPLVFVPGIALDDEIQSAALKRRAHLII